MKKIISGALLLVVALAQAMDKEEEAIILNQELQYLKESAKIPAIRASQATPVLSDTPAAPARSRSLEETYFGADEKDAVSTRAAARRRRTDD